MDCSNGNIGIMDELIENGSDSKDLVPISWEDATPKQRREGKVSKHDHRSSLGKTLTKNQAKRRRKKLKKK